MTEGKRKPTMHSSQEFLLYEYLTCTLLEKDEVQSTGTLNKKEILDDYVKIFKFFESYSHEQRARGV